ncbi:MAG: hypothetical protein HQL11_06000, partial [Candidatus Omnitrophica bacterium]|nr:hypothetical protein [Candidatus Omnitrophota bacterium]
TVLPVPASDDPEDVNAAATQGLKYTDRGTPNFWSSIWEHKEWLALFGSIALLGVFRGLAWLIKKSAPRKGGLLDESIRAGSAPKEAPAAPKTHPTTSPEEETSGSRLTQVQQAMRQVSLGNPTDSRGLPLDQRLANRIDRLERLARIRVARIQNRFPGFTLAEVPLEGPEDPNGLYVYFNQANRYGLARESLSVFVWKTALTQRGFMEEVSPEPMLGFLTQEVILPLIDAGKTPAEVRRVIGAYSDFWFHVANEGNRQHKKEGASWAQNRAMKMEAINDLLRDARINGFRDRFMSTAMFQRYLTPDQILATAPRVTPGDPAFDRNFVQQISNSMMEFLDHERTRLGVSPRRPLGSLWSSLRWIGNQVASVFAYGRTAVAGLVFWTGTAALWAWWNFSVLGGVWVYGIFPYFDFAAAGNPAALLVGGLTGICNALFLVLSVYTFGFLMQGLTAKLINLIKGNSMIKADNQPWIVAVLVSTLLYGGAAGGIGFLIWGAQLYYVWGTGLLGGFLGVLLDGDRSLRSAGTLLSRHARGGSTIHEDAAQAGTTGRARSTQTPYSMPFAGGASISQVDFPPVQAGVRPVPGAGGIDSYESQLLNEYQDLLDVMLFDHQISNTEHRRLSLRPGDTLRSLDTKGLGRVRDEIARIRLKNWANAYLRLVGGIPDVASWDEIPSRWIRFVTKPGDPFFYYYGPDGLDAVQDNGHTPFSWLAINRPGEYANLVADLYRRGWIDDDQLQRLLHLKQGEQLVDILGASPRQEVLDTIHRWANARLQTVWWTCEGAMNLRRAYEEKAREFHPTATEAQIRQMVDDKFKFVIIINGTPAEYTAAGKADALAHYRSMGEVFFKNPDRSLTEHGTGSYKAVLIQAVRDLVFDYDLAHFVDADTELRFEDARKLIHTGNEFIENPNLGIMQYRTYIFNSPYSFTTEAVRWAIGAFWGPVLRTRNAVGSPSFHGHNADLRNEFLFRNEGAAPDFVSEDFLVAMSFEGSGTVHRSLLSPVIDFVKRAAGSRVGKPQKEPVYERFAIESRTNDAVHYGEGQETDAQAYGGTTTRKWSSGTADGGMSEKLRELYADPKVPAAVKVDFKFGVGFYTILNRLAPYATLLYLFSLFWIGADQYAVLYRSFIYLTFMLGNTISIGTWHTYEEMKGGKIKGTGAFLKDFVTKLFGNWGPRVSSQGNSAELGLK